GHAVARRRRRQIDHAAIESVAVAEALAHVVVDRDVADLRLQHLAAAPRRRAEHDIAAGILVAHGRDVARLAAEDIEHAHAVVPRRDLRERADAHVILEIAYALPVHGDLPRRYARVG